MVLGSDVNTGMIRYMGSDGNIEIPGVPRMLMFS